MICFVWIRCVKGVGSFGWCVVMGEGCGGICYCCGCVGWR